MDDKKEINEMKSRRNLQFLHARMEGGKKGIRGLEQGQKCPWGEKE